MNRLLLRGQGGFTFRSGAFAESLGSAGHVD